MNPAVEPLEPRQLLSSGDLDPTFGPRGKVLAPPTGGTNVVGQPADGRIITASANTLRRFEPDGRRDKTFGDQGLAESPVTIYDVALQGDKIVVAGQYNKQFAVA